MWLWTLMAHADPAPASDPGWLVAPLTERTGSARGIAFTLRVPEPVDIASRTGWERVTADHQTMVGVYGVDVADGDLNARVAAFRELAALMPHGKLVDEARPDGHVLLDSSGVNRFVTLPGPILVQCTVTSKDDRGSDEARRQRFLEICDSLVVQAR